MAVAPPTIRRHVITLGVIAVLVAVVAYAVVLARGTTPTVERPSAPVASATLHAGSIAPSDFSLPRLTGSGRLSMASLLRGRPAVINFFASWCPECAAELAAFAAVSHEEATRVSFVGVDTLEHDAALSRTLLHKAG